MSESDIGSGPQAIRFGQDDVDIPEANATVRINNCSGTLIAPDLVLGAGHCTEHSAGVQDPWRPPADCTDTSVPGRWYPTAQNVVGATTVRLGNDRDNPLFQTEATDYAIPGCADMVLWRLSDPVPAGIATPVKVLTSLGGKTGAGDAADLAGQQLTQVGWGPSTPGGPLTTIRQTGTTTYASHDEEKLYTGGRTGDAQVLGGDSGGPLYWTHGSGQRYVVAVLQGVQGARSRYTPTFRNPAKKGGALLPGVGEFFTLVAPEAVADARSLSGPPGTLALTAWWSPGRQDNQLTTDPRMIGAAGTVRGPDYRFVGCEGHVFHPGLPAPHGTVPVHRWWDPKRQDNHTSSEAFMARWPGDGWHRDPDYGYARLEGYVFSPEYRQPAGTIPLLKWWSPGRKDNHTTTRFADRGRRGEGLEPDYVRPRVLGYVFPA